MRAEKNVSILFPTTAVAYKRCQLSLSFLVCYDNSRPPNNSNDQPTKRERSFSEDNVIAAPLRILHEVNS